jgi:subtilisin family serine protease
MRFSRTALSCCLAITAVFAKPVFSVGEDEIKSLCGLKSNANVFNNSGDNGGQGKPMDNNGNGKPTVTITDEYPEQHQENSGGRPSDNTFDDNAYDRHVIIKFSPGKKDDVKNGLLNMGGAKFHHEFDKLNAMAVSAPGNSIDAIKKNPNVELVEDDGILVLDRGLETSSQVDRMLVEQTPYGVNMVQAPQAWASGFTGSGIKVCVIDSGIDADHGDLSSIPKTGYSPSGEAWDVDTCNHGTHVAGTIAATRNNNIGVAGVAPGVSLYIVDVFDGTSCNWAYTSSVLDAAQRCASNGAKVINMSFGCLCGTNCFSSVARDGFAALKNNQGVLAIAAAGNCGNNEISYPAGYDAVVSVAAVDSNKNHAAFSQSNADVEIAAPGVDVLSTVNGNVYGSYQGTSMAAPHVAGVAALLWSAKPNSSLDEIRQALTQTAEDRGSPALYGSGIVQAMDAITF